MSQAIISWEPQVIAKDHWQQFHFGALIILLLKLEDEWRLTHWRAVDSPLAKHRGHKDELPDHLVWRAWDCREEDQRFQFLPAYPSLPLIARPINAVTLSKQGSKLIHLAIPAAVQIRASCHGELSSLTTLSSENLTKTWHGTRSVGRVCYSLKANIFNKVELPHWPAHQIIVSLDIVNDNNSSFTFERFYLETGHFGIFHHQNHLWSNGARLRIGRYSDEFSDITFTSRPLGEASKANEIRAPRWGRTRKSRLKQTFTSFIDNVYD